jgi:Zn finger protein HypA/HybF involved in hydrogenase expression
VDVVQLNRTLDQELLALMRGASLQCLVCGEFVMHVRGGIVCPECGAGFETTAESRLQLGSQAG